jgi:hypothetical protein
MTESGRAALVLALKNQTIQLAWGSGDASWDDDLPPEDANATALVNEIGRVYAFSSLFVVPDADGEITLPNDRRYSVSATPTRHLYADFKFGYVNGVGSTIREYGLFIGGTVKDTVPPGKKLPFTGRSRIARCPVHARKQSTFDPHGVARSNRTMGYISLRRGMINGKH